MKLRSKIFAARVVGLVFMAMLSKPAEASQVTYLDAQHVPHLPNAFKDALGNTYYVESDGRHISAINSDGRILWTRNPFVDAHLEAYRVPDARITFLGAAEEWRCEAENKGRPCIAIAFESTQFGVLDVATGDFIFAGQD